MRISYSNINAFQSCPLKYKYQNIDKIKAPKNIDAVFGSSVHMALKFMFQRDPLYPTLDQVIDFFREAWRNKKTSLEEKNKKDGEEETDAQIEDMLYKDGINILEKFYKNNPPWNFNIVDMESWFDFEVEDEKTGEKHTLSGIMDRVDKTNDDVFEIIDYKTGRKMPSQKDVDENLQLSIYQLGLMNKWPHLDPKKIKLSLYFLKHGEKISTSRTKEQLGDTKRMILGVIKDINDKIKENNSFPPTPSGLCDWCEYKQMCPMWRHMYKKENQISNLKSQNEIKEIIREYFKLKDENGKNNDRLDELKTIVYGFMDEQNVERVFGDEGYLTRTTKEKNVYDMEKTKGILEPAGRWKDILEPDDKKLDKLLPSLSDDLREKILTITAKKKTVTLNMRKKVSIDEDENGEEKII